MDDILKQLSPNDSFYTVYAGRKNSEIARRYRDEIEAINIFIPDTALIHVGHNELARHPVMNRTPLVSRDVAKLTLDFSAEVASNHSTVKMCISNVFPRCLTPNSILTGPEILKFNKTSKRHGQHLRTLAMETDFSVALNNPIWKHIASAQEDPSFYLPDGLHLNMDGKRENATDWLRHLTSL
jgi:hypothetical protein